jgi:hypothetical protein
MAGAFERAFTARTRPERIGAGPEVFPARSFLPLVFDLAEESRTHNGAGLFDAGEVWRQKCALNLESSIPIDSSNFRLLVLANNEKFVAVMCHVERIVSVFHVDPTAEEFRFPGSESCEGGGTDQADGHDAGDKSFVEVSPMVLFD